MEEFGHSNIDNQTTPTTGKFFENLKSARRFLTSGESELGPLCAARLRLSPCFLWVRVTRAHLLLKKFQLQRPQYRILEQLWLLGLSVALGTIVDGLQRLELESLLDWVDRSCVKYVD